MEAKSATVVFTMGLEKGVILQGVLEIDYEGKFFAQAEKIATEVLDKMGKEYKIDCITAYIPDFVKNTQQPLN